MYYEHLQHPYVQHCTHIYSALQFSAIHFLHYIGIYFTEQCWTVLSCIVFNCIQMYSPVFDFIGLYWVVLVLYWIVLDCIGLYYGIQRERPVSQGRPLH